MALMTSDEKGAIHNRRQRADPQRLQNVLLIWLDACAGDDTDDCRNTVMQLRRAINDVNSYTDGEQCIQFIEMNRDNMICMVTSGSLGQHTVPRVHDLPQVDSIFIFCSNKKYHEEWTKDWPKIKGVFTEIAPISEALRQAAQSCEHNATPMSFVASDASIDRLDSSFMYTQILKEILSTIQFNDQNFQEYVDYCREAFQGNPEELKNITQLEQHYREREPIWWYTSECFLYPMLNRALRTMDGDIMTRMGFFINDLHRNVEREYQKQYVGADSFPTFTVYRGQGLSNADFEKLKKAKDGLLSFNCFLSTSKRRHVSWQFAERAASSPDLVGILFEMTIDSRQSMVPFASIRELSAVKNEDEVLFAMHSVFRVRDIKVVEGKSNLYEVYLSLTRDDDLQLRALMERVREESCPDTEGWSRLAMVLTHIDQLDMAEKIYETLLSQETSENRKATFYNQLAGIKYNRKEYKEAIEIYEKALAIQEQSLPPTHPTLASTYNNIGNVYDKMRDYPKALALHQKVLSMRQQSLPPVHLDLAMSYNNIGNVYNGMGDYSRALAAHEKALAIQQQTLPPIHPDVAMSYNNIGTAYGKMGSYSEACSALERAVQIAEQSLFPEHSLLKTIRENLLIIKKKL